jgi:hypothetical protein
MLARRQFLLGTASATVLGSSGPSRALVPALLAALAAIATLAAATGKAAQALEVVVSSGQRLWNTVSSIPSARAAQRDLEAMQEKLRHELVIRREVVVSASASQAPNAAVVTSIRFFLITRDTSDWGKVAPAIANAASALSSMAAVFREKALWFPAQAQDALAELPRLYESRVSILENLSGLSKGGAPKTDEELSAWSKLVDGYDELRVQSLKLIRALEAYLTKA